MAQISQRTYDKVPGCRATLSTAPGFLCTDHRAWALLSVRALTPCSGFTEARPVCPHHAVGVPCDGLGPAPHPLLSASCANPTPTGHVMKGTCCDTKAVHSLRTGPGRMAGGTASPDRRVHGPCCPRGQAAQALCSLTRGGTQPQTSITSQIQLQLEAQPGRHWALVRSHAEETATPLHCSMSSGTCPWVQ